MASSAVETEIESGDRVAISDSEDLWKFLSSGEEEGIKTGEITLLISDLPLEKSCIFSKEGNPRPIKNAEWDDIISLLNGSHKNLVITKLKIKKAESKNTAAGKKLMDKVEPLCKAISTSDTLEMISFDAMTKPFDAEDEMVTTVRSAVLERVLLGNKSVRVLSFENSVAWFLEEFELLCESQASGFCDKVENKVQVLELKKIKDSIIDSSSNKLAIGSGSDQEIEMFHAKFPEQVGRVLFPQLPPDGLVVV